VKAVSGKRLCRLLEINGWLLKRINGWVLKRINGSHHIYAKSDCNLRISVPVHGDCVLKIGLQKQLMKLADINELDL